MRERKTERIPIMFDRPLLEKVDEFSFSNRIRTRAGAIRELIKAGLEAKYLEDEKGDVTA